MFSRKIEAQIKQKLFKGKAIIIFGARQVGKTTMIKNIISTVNEKTLWFNGDEADVRELLSSTTSIHLKMLFGNNKIICIDEAQRIPNIGITLKLITDNIKNVQVIATGSSAFELSNKTNEALTGRKYEFWLYPFSFYELLQNSDLLTETRMLEHRLIYGCYPEVVTNNDNKIELLKLITGSYLYKDLLMIEGIKKPVLLEKLLKALALQLGSEVSYNELGKLLQTKSDTIEKYIHLLELVYVIFKVNAFSRNVRNELRKGKKIYFYDNGIRNAILGNFNNLQSRTDVGALWENYIISERKKIINSSYIKSYFWRTTQQQEVDYIETDAEKINAFEIKWNKKRKQKSLTFTRAYPESSFSIINKSNYYEFLTDNNRKKNN